MNSSPSQLRVSRQKQQLDNKIDTSGKENTPWTLKVIFVPYIPGDNPYQDLLIQSLEELGVKVEGLRLSECNERFLLNKARHFKPDILHFHWLQIFYSTQTKLQFGKRLVKFISLLLILRWMGIKIIWTVHNIQSHSSAKPELERTGGIVTTKLFHAIIAHSEQGKREIAANFYIQNYDKIKVIPHGNYIDYYENKIDSVEARKILDIPHSSLVLLFLGLIKPYKGVVELIKSFKRLKADEVELVIAGKICNEELGESISEEIEGCNKIKLIPEFVPDSQVQVYMNACDVVVLPYKDILTSGSILLAMSFGKACIAPRIGTIQDIALRARLFTNTETLRLLLYEY